MRVIGLDPGSIRTGYACYDGANNLVDAGYLTGDRRKDPAWERVVSMCVYLRELVESFRPDCIAIELTSGHVNRSRHKGGGAGLATYGLSVGGLYVYACVLAQESVRPIEVLPFVENVWTKGRSKESRRADVRLAVKEYRNMIANDSGGDVADAIGLCWAAQAKLKVANAT